MIQNKFDQRFSSVNDFDLLLTRARLATLQYNDVPYGLLEDAAVGITDGQVVWIGTSDEASGKTANHTRDCHGQLVTPGLIDCHTHIVYGGQRAKEFEARLNGASYAEIARMGGGIVSTVRSTRDSDEESLYEQAKPRLQRLMQDGVTTVEIKSGYGLDIDTEIKMLKTARRLGETHAVDVCTSFLGAHALPAEYKDRADDYIDFVCDQVLPKVAEAGLADAVDGFCETIGFTREQMARLFQAAKAHQLPVKLHAEQLSDQGGTGLAAEFQALSADHLEYVNDTDIAAMAEAGTVAVLLPGAFYCLRETQLPPIDALRTAGVPMALATDSNPGSSPINSLLLILNMACTLFRMTPEEALRGVTEHAATALGLGHDRGVIEVGRRADLAIWRVSEPAELSYRIGELLCEQRVVNGVLCAGEPDV